MNPNDILRHPHVDGVGFHNDLNRTIVALERAGHAAIYTIVIFSVLCTRCVVIKNCVQTWLLSLSPNPTIINIDDDCPSNIGQYPESWLLAGTLVN